MKNGNQAHMDLRLNILCLSFTNVLYNRLPLHLRTQVHFYRLLFSSSQTHHLTLFRCNFLGRFEP